MHPFFFHSFICSPLNRHAPQFEEGLRNAADPNGLHQRAKIQAMLVYYSSRMEAVSFLCCARDLDPGFFVSPSWAVEHEGLTFGSTQAWRESNDGVAEFMLQKIM